MSNVSINPGIAAEVAPITPPANGIATLEQLAVARNALAQGGLAQQTLAARNALGPIYSDALNLDGTIDQGKLSAGLNGSPAAYLAPEQLTASAQSNTAQTLAQTARLENAGVRLKGAADVFSTVLSAPPTTDPVPLLKNAAKTYLSSLSSVDQAAVGPMLDSLINTIPAPTTVTNPNGSSSISYGPARRAIAGYGALAGQNAQTMQYLSGTTLLNDVGSEQLPTSLNQASGDVTTAPSGIPLSISPNVAAGVVEKVNPDKSTTYTTVGGINAAVNGSGGQAGTAGAPAQLPALPKSLSNQLTTPATAPVGGVKGIPGAPGLGVEGQMDALQGKEGYLERLSDQVAGDAQQDVQYQHLATAMKTAQMGGLQSVKTDLASTLQGLLNVPGLKEAAGISDEQAKGMIGEVQGGGNDLSLPAIQVANKILLQNALMQAQQTQGANGGHMTDFLRQTSIAAQPAINTDPNATEEIVKMQEFLMGLRKKELSGLNAAVAENPTLGLGPWRQRWESALLRNKVLSNFSPFQEQQ